MNAPLPDPPDAAPPVFLLPAWTLPDAASASEAEAAYAAGIALKTLDDLVRSRPVWSGCWTARQALAGAAAAVRLMGRTEGEAELRDALLMPSGTPDLGPAGNVYAAFRKLGARTGATRGTDNTIAPALLQDLAGLMGLRFDAALAAAVTPAQTGPADAGPSRAAPFAAAALVARIHAVRPDAEALAFALADGLIARQLGWPAPVFLLMAQRDGPAFRSANGRGRVRPGDPAFARAVCLALAAGARAALRSAGEIDRRARQLALVAPKLRTKGAQAVIARVLEEDAVAASAPGSDLSRWASSRMFARLQQFGAVRELSGRPAFRIYGL